MVDVEADGPVPGLYSMIELGAIIVDPQLDRTFYTTVAPISDQYIQGALDVTNYTRKQTLTFNDPKLAIGYFDTWLNIELVSKNIRPMFISDNNGFDWQFVNYYFWKFLGRNPFGHSSTNLSSIYKGMRKNVRENFKYLRKTKHTHNPVDDAKGNAEAMLAMENMGMKF